MIDLAAIVAAHLARIVAGSPEPTPLDEVRQLYEDRRIGYAFDAALAKAERMGLVSRLAVAYGYDRAEDDGWFLISRGSFLAILSGPRGGYDN